MGVAVIILIVVSILGSGMALYTLWPPTFQLAYQQQFWNSTDIPIDPDVLIARDALYSSLYVVPFFIIGALALWTILTMNRRDEVF